MFLSEPFGHCGGCVSYSADAEDMSADVGPAGMYLGLVSSVPMASPFRAQNANAVPCCPNRTWQCVSL